MYMYTIIVHNDELSVVCLLTGVLVLDSTVFQP